MSLPVRKSGLFWTMVDGQAVVYDCASNQTHCLNPLAVKVWRLCDGRHQRDDIARVLATAGGEGSDAPVADAGNLVDAALDRFAELGLLENAERLDRRALGAAAVKGIAAGLVLSALVPTRAAAASPTGCAAISSQILCDAAPGCEWNSGFCGPLA